MVIWGVDVVIAGAAGIVAVEETADTIHPVLPSASPLEDEGGKLSDVELEAVGGSGETRVGITWGTRCPGPVSSYGIYGT